MGGGKSQFFAPSGYPALKARSKTMFKKLVFAALLLSIPAGSKALELSLEENKGESGTVGFVDIDRVFKEYSGTTEAREQFLGEIKKKEESINQHKRVVYALKADVAKLKQERAFALTLPSLLATEEQLKSAEARQQAAAVAASSAAITAISSAPAVAASSATDDGSKRVEASMPGFERAPAISSTHAVAASTEAATPALAQAGIVASTAAPDQLAPKDTVPAAFPAPAANQLPAESQPSGVNMPGVTSVPVSYFKFSVSTAVPEIDAAISAKEAELKQKEEDLKLYQRQVEKELLEYEGHRSEIILGRVYLVLKELAVRSGVSVVVDKRNILFGHSAVDLTDKLLTALEEER